MTPLSVVVVGSSPWREELTDDDLNMRVALALADRLGGRYDVIVPCGPAGPGRFDRSPVHVHRVAGRTRPGFLLAARRMLDQLAATRGAALMSSDPLAALAIEHSGARRRLPHIAHIQGEVIEPGPAYGGRLRRRALAALSRSAVRRASGVRVVSRSLRDAVAPLARCPVAVLGSRVDTTVFAPGRAEGPYADSVALMVGSLVDVKNHATIVRAWPRVMREFPHARLRIVGDGPQRPRLTGLIDDLALHANIELHGAVPHRHVPDLLRSASCLIHPSWSEGQPRAVLEGMACGLPVVCSDIPAHQEIVSPMAGHLVAPGDVEGWAAAIATILRDPRRAAELGRSGRSLVAERYDFATSIDRYAEFIRLVAVGHRIGAFSS